MQAIKSNHLVIGNGEVGSALRQVLKKTDVIDLNLRSVNANKYDYLHICMPYKDEKFIKIVQSYQKEFQPKLTIIHSTVPIGTSRKCDAVHSPIRGVHPNLAQGIRTFVKYFGGEKAKQAADIFKKLGIKVKAYKESETTEAIKLWDTTQYGWMIMLEKEIYKWCQKNGLDFATIYQEANRDYNQGYVKLGRSEVVRPYLSHKDGPIGGHCVIPNAHLLSSYITKELISFNERQKKDVR